MMTPTPAGTRLDVAWYPVDFELHIADPASLRWAREHWFHTQPPPFAPSGRVRIATRCDPEAVAAAGRMPSRGPVAVFGHRAYFHRIRLDGADALVSAGSLLIRESPDPERWSVLLSGTTANQDDKRLAAEVIRRELSRRDHLQVHAAAVSRAGRGLVLVGDSGAGKTSAALALSRSGHLLSGDRISLVAGGTGTRIVAYPDAVRLGLGTARDLGVADRLLNAPLLRPQNFRLPDGRLDDDAWRPGSRSKISLSRAEVAAHLGVGVACAAPLTDVVFLHRDPARATPWLRRVSRARAVDELGRHDMARRDEYRPWLDPSTPRGTPHRPVSEDLLTAGVRLWRVDWLPSVAACDALADVLFPLTACDREIR